MKHRSLCPILILTFFLIGACNLTSNARQAAPSVHPITSPTQPQPDIAVIEEVTSKTTKEIPTITPEIPTKTPPPDGTSLARSFPLAPDTNKVPGSDSEEEGDNHGTFQLISKAPVADTAWFYQSHLLQDGWVLRYSDANYQGGVTQHWKKDKLYLVMEFYYDETGLVIQCQWNRIDPQALQRLPASFPLPAEAEIVRASETSWEVYIPQDAGVTASFYQQESAALGWEAGITFGGMMGECDDDDCAAWEIDFPPGVTPMPTPTYDPRTSQTLVYTLPDGNEISLDIQPHQTATILHINMTLKNVESAELPEGVPIYPGYTVVSATPGTISYSVSADMETLIHFYIDELIAAEWTASGDNMMKTSVMYFQEWKKGPDSIQLQIFPIEGSNPSCLVTLSSNP